MATGEKLDWIYKSATSLVDREEYLLGRKVDKTLEQINEEEKAKKFVLPTPKNHVEHECIPPSIRDFNKIVQAEQVDLSAKLQEDPLVAIKKREEEARRQFLHNPVQLKKLQDALKKKESQERKHKRSKKKKHSDLDEQIRKKMKNLRTNPLGIGASKKELKRDKEDVLNTILMHKFNSLKDKLSDADLQDILDGRVTDTSDEEGLEKMHKRNVSSNSEGEEKKLPQRRKRKYSNEDKRRNSSSKRNDFEAEERKLSSKQYKGQTSSETLKRNNFTKRARSSEEKQNRRSRSRSIDVGRSNRDLKRTDNLEQKAKGERMSKETVKYKQEPYKNLEETIQGKESSSTEDSDSELDRKIMAQLRMLRGEAEAKARGTTYPEKPSAESKHSSPDSDRLKRSRQQFPKKPKQFGQHSDSSESEGGKYRYSDSEDEQLQKKSFGLVTSAGKKITLKKTEGPTKTDARPITKSEESTKSQKKHIKKMTEEEKERLRKEMMSNAKERDKEREENVKRYKKKDKYEEELISKKYDPDLVHTELLKSAKLSSVEQRIKSNVNNIQRSSRHMDQNFSRR